jgi:hypothetical protein
LFLDNNYKVLASHAVVGGADQGWQNANLPSNFNAGNSLSLSLSSSPYPLLLLILLIFLLLLS